MSNAVATPKDVRKQLRTLSAEEFMKSRTKAQLREVAETLSIKLPEGDMTKQAIYDGIVSGAKFPDPNLRGKSTVDSPVAAAWQKADAMFAKADAHVEKGGDYIPPRRKDITAAMQEQGIAYYTARTQYQAFFTATDKGRRRLADLSDDELPKVLRPALEAEVAATGAEKSGG